MKKLGRPKEPKCTPEVKEKMRALWATGLHTQREIAARFDVAQGIVQKIVSER
jgi:hypothetical protein